MKLKFEKKKFSHTEESSVPPSTPVPIFFFARVIHALPQGVFPTGTGGCAAVVAADGHQNLPECTSQRKEQLS